MREACGHLYSDTVTPALEALATCRPKIKKERHKRLVPLFALGVVLAVMFIFTAISMAGQFVYSYTATGSSYNRLNEHDVYMHRMDENIEQVMQNFKQA